MNLTWRWVLFTWLLYITRQLCLKHFFPLRSYWFELFQSINIIYSGFVFVFSLLTAYCFDHQVLPTVVKMFASTDRAIRVGLLQHIDTFGSGLSSQVVDEQVCKQTELQQTFLVSLLVPCSWSFSTFILSHYICLPGCRFSLILRQALLTHPLSSESLPWSPCFYLHQR